MCGYVMRSSRMMMTTSTYEVRMKSDEMEDNMIHLYETLPTNIMKHTQQTNVVDVWFQQMGL